MGKEHGLKLKARLEAFRQRPETERNLIFARLVLLANFTALVSSIFIPGIFLKNLDPNIGLYGAGIAFNIVSGIAASFNEERRGRQYSDWRRIDNRSSRR